MLFRWIFRIAGWHVDPDVPPETHRSVMIAAPHTSNWDFIVTRIAFSILRIPVRFTIKKEWLRFPFRRLMLALGAIGIDRSPKRPGEDRPSMTDAMAALFDEHRRLVVLVTPEGTRSLRSKWKTGFYYVALKAGVPITLGYVDYRRKVAGVGDVIHPSGDFEADMARIMDFYRDKHPAHPELFRLDERFDGAQNRPASNS